MSENILMCKIAHFLTVLCAILINPVRNCYVLTRCTIIDAKIAHSLSKLCAIFEFNVKNRASRGPNPIPAEGILILNKQLKIQNLQKIHVKVRNRKQK